MGLEPLVKAYQDDLPSGQGLVLKLEDRGNSSKVHLIGLEPLVKARERRCFRVK